MLDCGCAESFRLIGLSEFAQLCGISQQAVCNWKTNHHDFPAPVEVIGRSPKWFLWQARYWQLQREARRNHPKWKQPARADLPPEKVGHIRERERLWRRNHPDAYREIQRRYRHNNQETFRNYARLQATKHRHTVSDKYVKSVLARRFGMKLRELPQEELPLLVDLMRLVLIFKRLLKRNGVQVIYEYNNKGDVMEPSKRTMAGLRDIIWDQIDKVQKKEIDLDRAKLVLEAADTIINSFKVEIAHAIAFKKGPLKELPLAGGKDEEGMEGTAKTIAATGTVVKAEGEGSPVEGGE